jgi:nucleotide-binding universal stress UspA family protein
MWTAANVLNVSSWVVSNPLGHQQARHPRRARLCSRVFHTGSAGQGLTLQVVNRCLVLGYDRTDAARAAARWAGSQLQESGKLVVVHAGRSLHVPPALSTESERRRLGRALIDELLLEGEDALIDAEVEVEVLDTDPVSALTDAARRHEADAIVVGHDRHSRLHTAIGTVTGQLIEDSSVPVVVVPRAASAG